MILQAVCGPQPGWAGPPAKTQGAAARPTRPYTLKAPARPYTLKPKVLSAGREPSGVGGWVGGSLIAAHLLLTHRRAPPHSSPRTSSLISAHLLTHRRTPHSSTLMYYPPHTSHSVHYHTPHIQCHLKRRRRRLGFRVSHPAAWGSGLPTQQPDPLPLCYASPTAPPAHGAALPPPAASQEGPRPGVQYRPPPRIKKLLPRPTATAPPPTHTHDHAGPSVHK